MIFDLLSCWPWFQIVSYLVSFVVAIAALGRLWLHSYGVLSFAISWDTSHPYPFTSTITLLFTRMSVLWHCLYLNRELKWIRVEYGIPGLGFTPHLGPAVTFVSFGDRWCSLLKAHTQVWFLGLQENKWSSSHIHELKHRQWVTFLKDIAGSQPWMSNSPQDPL